MKFELIDGNYAGHSRRSLFYGFIFSAVLHGGLITYWGLFAQTPKKLEIPKSTPKPIEVTMWSEPISGEEGSGGNKAKTQAIARTTSPTTISTASKHQNTAPHFSRSPQTPITSASKPEPQAVHPATIAPKPTTAPKPTDSLIPKIGTTPTTSRINSTSATPKPSKTNQPVTSSHTGTGNNTGETTHEPLNINRRTTATASNTGNGASNNAGNGTGSGNGSGSSSGTGSGNGSGNGTGNGTATRSDPTPPPKPQAPPPAPKPQGVNCVQGCGDRHDHLNGQKGFVIVQVEIAPSGNVVSASIATSSGNPRLDSKAIAAARQMSFNARDSSTNEFRRVKINLGS